MEDYLNDWAKLAGTPIRKWSPEPFEGSVPDTFKGGYCESDKSFKERIKKGLEIPK